MRVPIVVALSLVSSFAVAATLEVGPSATYPTPCSAIAAAQPDDEIDVAPGTYTDSCEIKVAGLIVKGVGGQPKLDLSATDHPADYKGILVISADNVRIENLELTGAHIPVDVDHGGNGAGLRIQASGAVVHGCYIHDNQNGILAGPTAGDNTGTLTVENSEIARNGRDAACTTPGLSCTHNVYVGAYARFVFQYNWTHQVANDTPDKGHLLKSRAAETDVLYNRITGEDGLSSYEVDLPNGGLAILIGNVIQQGANTGNPTMLAYAEEGLLRADNRLFVVGNTFVNDLGKGTFLEVAPGATLMAFDNFLVGAGTPSSTGALSADNLVTTSPAFVDATNYDYHLTATSPAIGNAVTPGKADARSLTPTFEYVQPLGSVVRESEHDVGAFEYSTTTMTSMDASTSAPSDGGTIFTGKPKSRGCNASDAAPSFASIVVLLVVCLLARRHRA